MQPMSMVFGELNLDEDGLVKQSRREVQITMTFDSFSQGGERSTKLLICWAKIWGTQLETSLGEYSALTAVLFAAPLITTAFSD